MDQQDIDPQALRRGTDEVSRVAADRRQFLMRAGIGGAVLAVGAGAISAASFASGATAQTATTAELPEGDVEWLAFLQGFELAAAEAYDAAIATNRLEVVVQESVRTFGLHHEEAATSLGTLADKKAPNVANPQLVQQFVNPVKAATDQNAIIQLLYGMEEQGAATYASALETITGVETAALASSILPVEGQQAVVWGEALKLPIDQWLPNFQSKTNALDPSRFATS